MKTKLLVLVLSSIGSASLHAQSAQLVRIGGFDSGLGTGASEIVAYEPVGRRAYVVNAAANSFDILDLSAPGTPTLTRRVSVTDQGSAPNSVAVHGSIVAVAVEGAPQTVGKLVFYTLNGDFVGAVTAGALPDMVAISPDGRWALVANEGEPNAAYTNDPEGSISVVDLQNGAAAATVRTAGFAEFNTGGPLASQLPPGVRVFGPNATFARDAEPEYVAISSDSRTAYVSLQENNAIAVVYILSARVTRIIALGTKNHALTANAMDASDRDGPANGPAINLRNWPVHGLFLPDAIAVYERNGRSFVLTANEGDTREYTGFAEEARVSSLTLDAGAFPNGAELKQNANLGRLTVTRTLGDTDADGDFDQLVAPGTRSFSMFDVGSGALAFDSGDQFERTTAQQAPTLFNSEGLVAGFDTRSDNKGPEPEGITTASIGGRQLAFISNERIGGAFVYDITDPALSTQLSYGASTGGDRAPEGIVYVAPANNATNRPLLLMANEVSGTLGVYRVDLCTVSRIESLRGNGFSLAGYCPDGLDIVRRRFGTLSTVRTGVTLDGNLLLNIGMQFGDEYFAALPGTQTPINGLLTGTQIEAIPALGNRGLALIVLLVGMFGFGFAPQRRGHLST